MSLTKIRIQTQVSGNSKKVLEHYTQPQHIIHWNFASDDWQCPSASNDMKVGGKYCARMEAKDGSFGFDFEAVYDEIIEGKKFSYTMPDNRKVSVQFNENNNNNTEVIIDFDAESVNPVEMQQAGWQAILNNFKKYSEAH